MSNFSMMKVVQLQPNVWTEIEGRYIQTREQAQLRIAVCDMQESTPGIWDKPVPPAADTDAYFLTPGFDSKPVCIRDYAYINTDPAAPNPWPVYAMPHEDRPLKVVICK